MNCFFFFFNDTATTEIYTLSLHDALPISALCWHNLAVAERPRLWAQGLDRSTPLLKGQSRAVFPSSRVSAASPRARTLNSGRLAQPCFWHFGGQRALDHLLGWEREGSTNCTLET